MRSISDVIRTVSPADEAIRREAKKRWDGVAKPLGSLGCLEESLIRIAALRGSTDFSLKNRALIVFCADNGVSVRGVSQCGSGVTAKVAVALAEGRSTASVMAKKAACRVIPADVGILDFPGHPGVLDLRVRNGTGDISRGPAMTEEECLLAMERGAALAEELAGAGTDLFVTTTTLGLSCGKTTTAAALSAALLGMEPEETVGRGAGLSMEGLLRKREAVRQALAVNRPDREDTVGLLSCVGGLDLAAMCGAFLGAAACRVPVVIDGMISACAALCAQRICPDASAAMLASHVSSEPAGRLLLHELGLHAPLDAGMHLGEGTGALMLMPLLDMAWEVYHGGQSFEQLSIEPYRHLA